MEGSLILTARNGCAHQINRLWSQMFPLERQLIVTEESIRTDVDFFKTCPIAPRWIRDYFAEKNDPIAAWRDIWGDAGMLSLGHGRVFLDSHGGGGEGTQYMKQQVLFVLEHQALFEVVAGLESARRYLGIEVSDVQVQNFKRK